MLEDDTTLAECRRQAIAMCPLKFVSLLTKEGICCNGTITTIRVNGKRQMGLPAPILSGPSILYLGLAAHKYSNKVHLSMFLLEEMLWMKWRESRPHSHAQQGCWQIRSYSALSPQLWLCRRLLIGFIPSDIFSRPSLLRADWQIGGVIATKKHAGQRASCFFYYYYFFLNGVTHA